MSIEPHFRKIESKSTMYHRVLLKISGEALSSNNPSSAVKREEHGRKIKAVRQKGVQIGIVVGGGNIMRGRSAEEWNETERITWACWRPRSTRCVAGCAGIRRCAWCGAIRGGDGSLL
jgi:hypothetical protein